MSPKRKEGKNKRKEELTRVWTGDGAFAQFAAKPVV
jgi:hypothetical protein